MAAKCYVLDTNVFIQAHQTYYAFNTCPGFWAALLRHHRHQRLCSIDQVRAELIVGKDALSDWAKKNAPSTFFKGTKEKAVAAVFQGIANWVQSQPQFTQEATADFFRVADGWVVAYALAHG